MDTRFSLFSCRRTDLPARNMGFPGIFSSCRTRSFQPLALLGLFLLGGCHSAAPTIGSKTSELSPAQYQLLRDDEKIRYKNIIVRVPESMGGALLPFDAGPYPSAMDKAVHGGDLSTLTGLYNQSMFELEHPRVKIEYINFDMWSS